MNQFNNKKRRIGGLVLEVLVLIFVFSSSWSQTEFTDKNSRGQLIVKTSPVEQIAFCNSDFSLKSLLEFISKIQISHNSFSPVLVDLPARDIENRTVFSISPSLHNTFYIHLTAKAP